MSFPETLNSRPDFNTFRQTVPWQSVSFSVALILYAFAGSPTPDGLGLAEIATAALLLISMSLPALKKLPVPVAAFVFYGLSLPLLVGVVSGHGTASIIRDLIPFGFLLMPILYHHQKVSPWWIVLIGVVFAIRSLIPYKDVLEHPQIWLGQPPADLLYLANSPEVLFSALFLFGMGGFLIWTRRSFLIGFVMTVLSGVPILAMAVMMQRAGVGCVILAGLIWGAIGFWLRPAHMVVTGGLLLLLVLPFVPLMESVMGTLVMKTELVGLNSRSQEWETVFNHISHSPWTMLFGLGWGLTFENPAVGNLPVNYTHSLISAMLLKTGVIGVVLLLLYLWILAKQAVPELFRSPVLVVALAMPLGIGLLFYASYKSLGFGLLLLVLANSAFYRKLEKNQRDMP